MRVQLEKGGVLGAGQVKKGGSLPRHIPILNIYVSTPPPPGDYPLDKIGYFEIGFERRKSCKYILDGGKEGLLIFVIASKNSFGVYSQSHCGCSPNVLVTA